MGNLRMKADQISYKGGETPMSVEEVLRNTSSEAAAIAQLQTDVATLNSTKTNQITIAPFFSAEASYDPGDLVYYNGLSYRCVNAHEGAWDADDFAATTIANELSSLMSGLIKQNLTFTPSENVTVAYGYVKKQLDVVNLFLQCQKVLTLDGWDQIGRLPEGARPQHNIYIGAVTLNKDGIDAYIECQVAANGYVWVYPKTGHESAVATNILINSTFIV